MKTAQEIALNFLKFRPRSVFEVRQKLKLKKISEAEIDKIIDLLVENKLLDDRDFARMWVKDRNLLKPTGTYLLRLELRKFGIDEEIIHEALADQDEEKLARETLERAGRYREADFEKKAQFLRRRGFKTDIILKILNSA